MIIDVIFLLLLAIAVIKGISRGFIIAIFSFVAIILGVVAAMKLSSVVAEKIEQSFNTGKQWLPFLSFLLVLIAVVFLVRFIAGIIQRAVNMAMLGWLNKLGGVVLFVLLYISVYSVVLFYLTQMNIIKPETVSASHTYGFIEPFGPKIVDTIAWIIPVFKNLFQQLSHFFGSIASQKHSA